MKIAFTGHRPESLPFKEGDDAYERFERLLCKEIGLHIQNGYDTFYCGLARGADIICGKIILFEKLSGASNLTLICVKPFFDHGKNWGFKWKYDHQTLINRADKVECIDLSYRRGSYHARNRYMVDHCDMLFAIYDGRPKGGTAYTVEYARRKGKKIVILDPQTLELSVILPQEHIQKK